MALKKCCIEKCKSCSSRKEDAGVTYHKFPKNALLHEKWIKITHIKITNTDTPKYVCSRHFRKKDFRLFKESKYILKSDAVPSIFPWTLESKNKTMEISLEDLGVVEKSKELNSSKESEENVDAIKSFIEEQEREIQEQKSDTNSLRSLEEQERQVKCEEETEETLAVASSVMDMILSESETRIAQKKDVKALGKQCLSAADKGNSMSLSVGSKVEAKDFGEFWHPAQILEVDYDEMEVLVHYENESKKHDEWISVSSPRLRPLACKETDITNESSNVQANVSSKDEMKTDDKPKLQYVVGERCLARWRDNRRFMATITNDLGNGSYEIVFDDGFNWKCTVSRLHKLKQPVGRSTEPYDSPSHSSNESNPSPLPYAAGPSIAAATTSSPIPAYHTHLFDPARDYLGSKSERREMKRKLNIKEIFNIGQKRKKIKSPKEKKPRVVTERKPKIVRRKLKAKAVTDTEIKAVLKTVPDAVASIIGTVSKESIKDEIPTEELKTEEGVKPEHENSETEDIIPKEDSNDTDVPSTDTSKEMEIDEIKIDIDSVPEEEKLEKFESDNNDKHVEVIDRMKVVINKLEDEVEKISSPRPDVKKEDEIKKEDVVKIENEVKKEDEVKKEEVKEEVKPEEADVTEKPKQKKGLSKVKKGKKMRLLQEKKVKKQVEKVKSELEEMKKQFEEMRKQMLLKTEELAKSPHTPESFLLPGEWCCKWVNGQPVGTVSELEVVAKADGTKPGLPRRSVQVDDKRLPPGWTKHMVRRSFGHSAGKWDVVLVSPENERFHTKTDMRNFLENNPDESLKPYEYALLDFGVHLKLSRRLGWVFSTPGGVDDTPVVPLPAGTLSSTSPLVKRKRLSLKKGLKKEKKKRLAIKLKLPVDSPSEASSLDIAAPGTSRNVTAHTTLSSEVTFDGSTLEDGYVHVGALKVQVIDNLLRCPAEGCLKNFRNNTLLQMHIKHYHRELRKMMGRTPKVLDLAYARTMPIETETKLKCEAEPKTIKVKMPKIAKRLENAEHKNEAKEKEVNLESAPLTPVTPVKIDVEKVPRSQDSPKLRNALTHKPVKRPRVLLPVRRLEPEQPEELAQTIQEPDDFEQNDISMEMPESSNVEILDFETAISTHTVTKPILEKKKNEKKRKIFAAVAKKPMSEDEEWFGMNSDVETRSSFPRSGSPDSKTTENKTMQPISSESNEEQKDTNMYMYTENGERIKIVHMKREEIINCHCGFREEDGLMVQCELCLCWQHALCHNIQKESEVPEKYTCSICLNPRRGRRSQRFLHDQDRLYEGLLPGARPCESLRRSHELSGNLLRIEDALHALRVKYYVATKKDHPKLYLWAKDWENGDINVTQDKLNSDYSDLNIMISSIGKENLPIKPEEINNLPMDMRSPPLEDQDERRTQVLLSGLLSSPGGGSLDLPISTSELERLAKSVEEQEQHRVIVPQPEAAIENSACRERLLRHIQRCQVLIDARLDSIEAQVAELESQDPSFEDDETADYFPRTKQTIQMLMRDLDTMEELGVIT